METDQRGELADEKEEEEKSSKKHKITQIEQPEIFVDKVNSTIPLQHTNHKAQSTSVVTERSKEETDGKMPFIREISYNEKRPLNEWQNMGGKEAFLGTEEFKGFSSNMHKFQGKESLICIESTAKETSCLMSNFYGGTESSDESNKAKKSLIGVRRQKNGKYGAVITDKIRHKQVWLGTFDTVEEASQAYFSKKSEFEKLSQQGNKDNEPKENLDQIQQPESPIVKVKSTKHFQHTNNMESSNIGNMRLHRTEPKTSVVAERSKNGDGEKLKQRKEPEYYSTISNPKDKISLIGIQRRKSGRYAAVIRDRFRHKRVWLGTFDTVEEASQAYLSKKTEFEKLSQGRNKEDRSKKNCDPHKTTHIIGAHKRKMSGKYSSEITNPISKKRIWLGTFDTAEEASRAYQSKKLEFQKLVKAKQQQQCTNKQTHSKQDRKSENLVSAKHEHENVNCELKSADGSEINVLISNSSRRGTNQQINYPEIGVAEEAFHAYLSNKFDSQSSKEAKMQSDMPTNSSAGEKQDGHEDYEDLWMGEWVQLPGDDKAVMFSLKLGLPIIDNYGYLLGEFSSLDDLSIS